MVTTFSKNKRCSKIIRRYFEELCKKLIIVDNQKEIKTRLSWISLLCHLRNQKKVVRQQKNKGKLKELKEAPAKAVFYRSKFTAFSNDRQFFRS